MANDEDKTKVQWFGSLGVPDPLLRKAKLIAAVDGSTRNKVLMKAMQVGIEQMSVGLEERIQKYLLGEGDDLEEEEQDGETSA